VVADIYTKSPHIAARCRRSTADNSSPQAVCGPERAPPVGH
jgi:hypothetical protein